ncbi:ABC transporter ATP-binding protein [Leucobacter sp. Psy1]|uniref:ATP-binding cassette domain-containing protein n=1 Tax=Leucobacter sp. Psy1 TaxID=2875729 RepID=UPI001CD42B8A|nr:ATP-binding cassette domain-containing protein [Leucobacter sp. Psy1]UBH04720.1 ABC transporter ATP-binding protein [Leucobacter sp. Psy1]
MTTPTTAPRVEVSGLTKRFGRVQAVNGLSFTAEPGRVTGFLGPNGSGKTTTLSMLLGLVRPDSGTATVGGQPYAALERPATVVGSLLSADFHPAHTATAHLDIARRAIGVPQHRVAETLEMVGLRDAAHRKTGGFSLGMRQRLALAAALLPDPQVIVLDEPINGLDPEGIRWIRQLLRHLASEGRTVLLSSHLLSEVQQTVDDVVIIRRGEAAYTGPLEGLQPSADDRVVLVSTPNNHRLAQAMEHAGLEVHGSRGDVMRVSGASPETVGNLAFDAGLPLSHLSTEEAGLEERFLALIGEGGSSAGAEPTSTHTEEGSA